MLSPAKYASLRSPACAAPGVARARAAGGCGAGPCRGRAGGKGNVAFECSAQPIARVRDPEPARLPFGDGLSRLAAGDALSVRQPALPLGRPSDDRPAALVRLRHLLCLARHLPDVLDVLP